MLGDNLRAMKRYETKVPPEIRKEGPVACAPAERRISPWEAVFTVNRAYLPPRPPSMASNLLRTRLREHVTDCGAGIAKIII